jgi:DNA repair protein RecO (recombination protein O)
MLHRYDWSESSLILEVFTRHHGRIALVAKGAKKPSSSFRPVLLPMQLLHVSFGGDADIRTLKSAEWQGGHVMPSGDALMSGYYLNELLLLLLARDDAHTHLFDCYDQVIQMIASEHTEVLQAALRTFELLLLRELGFLPRLDVQTLTMTPLQPEANYVLDPEGGMRLAQVHERTSLSGLQWCTLQAALKDHACAVALLRVCAGFAVELKPQLRSLLYYHGGIRSLRTRQMMIELQSL